MSAGFESKLRVSRIPRARGYEFYFRQFVFRGVNLRSRSILDVGGGNGLASFWAVAEGGAANALVLEPQVEGSNSNMDEQFAAMTANFALSDRVSLQRGFLRDLDANPAMNLFDVACLHNMINHVDEEAVASVTSDASSRKVFIDFAMDLLRFLKPGAPVLIIDCARRNLWGDLHLPNPVAPGIDWRIHQSPTIWRRIFEDAGYGFTGISWFPRRELGRMGKIFLGNRVGSYLTTSVFRLEMTFRRG